MNQTTASRSESRPPGPPTPVPPLGRRVLWRVFPLVWLGYLFFPIRSFLSTPHAPVQTLLAAVGLVAFVGVWFTIYARYPWNRHHRRLLTLGVAGCLLLYAAGLGVIGYDSATFLVYAGALIGFQSSFRLALGGLLVIVAALLTPGWLGYEHLGTVDLVQILVLTCVALYGNQAAFRQTISSARLVRVQAEKERLAADAERERIARDLHDLLGHTLSVIVLKSELARKLGERDPARAFAEIAEVERISREALSEVRSAVRGYQGSGLSAELARSKLALNTAGVRLDLDAEPLSLPPEVEYAMEMVLREAVTNIVRHAQAQTVVVLVSRPGTQYLLEVQDDGQGRGEAAEGTGLTSMRERVRAAGGQFGLAGAGMAGRGGTTVRASFPVRAEGRSIGAAQTACPEGQLDSRSLS